MIYKRFLALIALSLFAIQLHPSSKSLRDRDLYAAELSPKSITLQILFNSGQFQIEWHLANNLENAERFFTQLDSLSKEPGIKISNRVHIFASASPEGISTLNNELSQKRAEALAALLKERALLMERALPNAQIEITAVGEDWTKLAQLLRNSAHNYNKRAKERAIRTIEQTPRYIFKGNKIVGGRKKTVMEIQRGEFWQQMSRELFPILRQATLTIYYSPLRPQLADPNKRITEVTPPALKQEEIAAKTTKGNNGAMPLLPQFPAAQINPKAGRPLFAIKSNLLFDAATLVNLGVEIPIGSRYSIGADLYFPWWQSSKNDITVQMLGGTVEGRYWWGKRVNEGIGSTRAVMTGFFTGLYLGAGYFDFQLGKLTNSRGVQGEFYIMGGISAGYTHKISNTFRMEYSLGIGYMQCDYKEYITAKDTRFGNIKVFPYPWEVKRLSTIFPTKAAISLVWMLQSKRGGER